MRDVALIFIFRLLMGRLVHVLCCALHLHALVVVGGWWLHKNVA